MKLTMAPLEPWLHPSGQWSRADLRTWSRAKESGYITEEAADLLCIKYAGMQLEVIHPDYHP